MSSSRTRGSKPEKGSSRRMISGEKARMLARAAFMSMPRERFLSLRSSGSSSWWIEGGVVPGGVEALQIAEELAYGHPVGELLVFAGVGDAGEVGAGEVGDVPAEDGGGAGGRVNHVHQQLDEGGLAGAVMPDEREDCAAGHGEGDGMEGLGAAVALGERVGLNGWVLFGCGGTGCGHVEARLQESGDPWRLA